MFPTIDEYIRQLMYGTVDECIRRIMYPTVDECIRQIMYPTVDECIRQIMYATVDEQPFCSGLNMFIHIQQYCIWFLILKRHIWCVIQCHGIDRLIFDISVMQNECTIVIKHGNFDTRTFPYVFTPRGSLGTIAFIKDQFPDKLITADKEKIWFRNSCFKKRLTENVATAAVLEH